MIRGDESIERSEDDVLGRTWLARRLPMAVMEQIDELATRIGARTILLMRLLPVFNFDWVSYAAGISGVLVFPHHLSTMVIELRSVN